METSSESANIYEGPLIPQNLQWRAGINDPNIKQNICDPSTNFVKAFLQQWDRKPPTVEMPPIQKSKQDQYWDAVFNNSVVWKTSNNDTRPETQGELQAQQNPQMICD